MAIYHFSVKAISRSDGRSAVACAAYRSGEKLVCDYYGKEQDYTKKQVSNLQISMHLKIQIELLDRQKLWNTVEKVENRKIHFLPVNLKLPFPRIKRRTTKTLLDELCQELVKKHGVIVDAAIHAPHTEGGSDDRNYHAHIMFTTRSINKNGTLKQEIS
jgi:hypothetical protein